MLWLPTMQMKLLAHAYKADGGALYFEVADSGYFKHLALDGGDAHSQRGAGNV